MINYNKTRTIQYSNLLVSHAFTCWILVCFLSYVIIFDRDEQANAVSEDCSKQSQKIIHKTVVMEYFHSKLPNLKPKKKHSKQELILSCMEFFRTASLQKTLLQLTPFHVLYKACNSEVCSRILESLAKMFNVLALLILRTRTVFFN